MDYTKELQGLLDSKFCTATSDLNGGRVTFSSHADDDTAYQLYRDLHSLIRDNRRDYFKDGAVPNIQPPSDTHFIDVSPQFMRDFKTSQAHPAPVHKRTWVVHPEMQAAKKRIHRERDTRHHDLDLDIIERIATKSVCVFKNAGMECEIFFANLDDMKAVYKAVYPSSNDWSIANVDYSTADGISQSAALFYFSIPKAVFEHTKALHLDFREERGIELSVRDPLKLPKVIERFLKLDETLSPPVPDEERRSHRISHVKN